MYYQLLGQLADSDLDFIRSQLAHYAVSWHRQDQTWDYLPQLVSTVSEIFGTQPWPIQRDSQGLYSVKLFHTRPAQSSPIHKDGLRAQSALNICVDANPGDWIRWWDDSLADRLLSDTVDQQQRSSRNLRSGPVTQVLDWVCEFRPRPGQIYLVNTDRYHAYHCAGPENRRVIQTKFQGWPTIQQLAEGLRQSEIAMRPC